MKYSREDRSYENQHLPCLHDLGGMTHQLISSTLGRLG
jgi:hypothetical protein